VALGVATEGDARRGLVGGVVTKVRCDLALDAALLEALVVVEGVVGG